MVHWLTHLLERLGPILVFGLIFLESMGLPFPGETVLLTAAAFAAAGKLSIVWVAVAAVAGGFGGGSAGYVLGRTSVGAWLRRRGREGRGKAGQDEAGGITGHVVSGLGRAREFFHKHGGKSVLIGRFVAVVRSFVFIVAGAADMAPVPFLLWNAAGATLWGGAFSFLGYEFGHNLPRLEHTLGAAALAAAGALGLAAALGFLIRWTWRNQEWIWEATAAFYAARVQPRLEPIAKKHPRAWRFATNRLSPAGYLGLHLTIGILVSLIALWLFGGVLEDVVAGDPLTQFDQLLARTLHARATPLGIHFFLAISFLGSAGWWAALATAVLVFLLVRRRGLLAAGWVAAIVGGGVLDLGLKVLVHRPRPVFPLAFAQAPGWSFPSGHSMGSLVGYGMIAYLLLLAVGGEHARRIRVAIVLAATMLVVLIGTSRLYLGVHYFSDVIGGFAAGIVWLSACITGLEVARRRRRFREIVQRQS